MSRKIIHVIGTGTIGEPLIGLLCDYKDYLGIDEVTFHKNTPLTTDRSKVVSLNKRGARKKGTVGGGGPHSSHHKFALGWHRLQNRGAMKNQICRNACKGNQK